MPRSWLRIGKPSSTRKRRADRDEEVRRQRQPGDHSIWIGDEFGRVRNWIDLFRGLAGGAAIMTTLPVLIDRLLGVPGETAGNLNLALMGGVLLAATLIQMIRFEERVSLTPPIFFLAGISFAVVGPKAALIGFFAIWAINVALPNPMVFMTVYGTLIMVLGLGLGTNRLHTVLMAGLFVFPPFIAIMFKRRLAQFKKRNKLMVR